VALSLRFCPRLSPMNGIDNFALTSAVLCRDSEMTTPSVIQTLLDKFLITDSCQKFALYEKINYEQPKNPGLSLSHITSYSNY